LKKLKIEWEKLIKENNIKKIQKKDEYDNLINNYNLWKSKKGNRDKKFSLIKKMYKKGYIGFREYLKERNAFLEIELEFEKAKNELYVFEWKLKIIK